MTKIRSSKQLYIDEDLQFNAKKGVGLKKGTVTGDAVEFDQLKEVSDKLAPFTVTSEEVNIDRDVRIEGNIYFKAFVHHQGSALAVWVVNHKMGRTPSVVVTDNAGTTIEGNIRHVDETGTLSNDWTIISFNGAFSGHASFN